MTFLFIILFMFILDSNSKDGRETTASELLTHRFSVLQGKLCRRIFAILTFSSISPDKFRYEDS